MSKSNGNANGSTDLVPYEENKPIKTPKHARQLLQRFEGSIAEIIPAHITADRMLKLALVAINRNAKLLRCTQGSVIESLMRSAELGLDCSGTLGEAYLVPFGNKCQFMPGYRGLAKLARQSGKLVRLEAEIVCENDDFQYVKGTDFYLKWAINPREERGKPIGAYAYVEYKNGGEEADYMTTDEINDVRDSSPGKDGQPWREHWGEMAKKTVFRRLAKWLDLSHEPFDRAIQWSDEEFKPTYERSHIGRETGSDINEQLGLAEGEKAAESEAAEAQEASTFPDGYGDELPWPEEGEGE